MQVDTDARLKKENSNLTDSPNIHRVPPPMSFLLGCDRGQKTKPKIILAKFYPSLSLCRIRFQRFAKVTNQDTVYTRIVTYFRSFI